MQFSVLKLSIRKVTTRGSIVQRLLYFTYCVVKPRLVVSLKKTSYFLNSNWVKINEFYILRFYNASSLCSNIVIPLLSKGFI